MLVSSKHVPIYIDTMQRDHLYSPRVRSNLPPVLPDTSGASQHKKDCRLADILLHRDIDKDSNVDIEISLWQSYPANKKLLGLECGFHNVISLYPDDRSQITREVIGSSHPVITIGNRPFDIPQYAIEGTAEYPYISSPMQRRTQLVSQFLKPRTEDGFRIDNMDVDEDEPNETESIEQSREVGRLLDSEAARIALHREPYPALWQRFPHIPDEDLRVSGPELVSPTSNTLAVPMSNRKLLASRLGSPDHEPVDRSLNTESPAEAIERRLGSVRGVIAACEEMAYERPF